MVSKLSSRKSGCAARKSASLAAADSSVMGSLPMRAFSHYRNRHMAAPSRMWTERKPSVSSRVLQAFMRMAGLG